MTDKLSVYSQHLNCKMTVPKSFADALFLQSHSKRTLQQIAKIFLKDRSYFMKFCLDRDLLRFVLKANLLTFQSILTTLKKQNTLNILLFSPFSTRTMLSLHELLSEKELKALVRAITEPLELAHFISNDQLLHYVLTTQLLSKSDIRRFDSIVLQNSQEFLNQQSFFEYLIQDCLSKSVETTKKTEQHKFFQFHRSLYEFSFTSKKIRKQLIMLVDSNDVVYSRFLQISMSYSELSFQSYDELYAYLMKKEKKNMLNI